MSEQCQICSNHYEVCSSCKKAPTKMKGCVEDKKTGWHDNGGYMKDSEKDQKTGSWSKEKNNEQNEQK